MFGTESIYAFSQRKEFRWKSLMIWPRACDQDVEMQNLHQGFYDPVSASSPLHYGDAFPLWTINFLWFWYGHSSGQWFSLENDMEQLSMCSLTVRVASVVKCLFTSLAHLKLWIVFSLLNYELFILDAIPVSDMRFGSYFFTSLLLGFSFS